MAAHRFERKFAVQMIATSVGAGLKATYEKIQDIHNNQVAF